MYLTIIYIFLNGVFMITSKQRSYLKSLAHNLSPIFQLGKNGLGENFYKQIDQALEARELIKVRVLKSAVCETKEVCEDVANHVGADIVQVIGLKFVLYRESKEKKTITLPK
jgi:RNA-binding protein